MDKFTHYQIPRLLYVIILTTFSIFLALKFIVPVLMAGSIALAIYPFQLALERKNWKKSRAALLLTGIFTFVISIPFFFFVSKGSLVVIDLLERFTLGEKLQSQGMQQVIMTIKNDILFKVQKHLSSFAIADFLTIERMDSYLKSINEYLLIFFKNFAYNIPNVVLFFVVMIFCTYSFLKSASKVRVFFQDLFGFDTHKMDYLIGIFLRNSRQVYISNFLTGLTQALIVATGVSIVTNADWFLIFFVTLIFSFIPVIGAAPFAFLFSVVAYFQDNPVGAIILIVIGSVAGIIDNILRPWLASFGESKAPAIVSFIFVVGGALTLGFAGLFIGLLVAAVAYDTLPLFWEILAEKEPSLPPQKNDSSD